MACNSKNTTYTKQPHPASQKKEKHSKTKNVWKQIVFILNSLIGGMWGWEGKESQISNMLVCYICIKLVTNTFQIPPLTDLFSKFNWTRVKQHDLTLNLHLFWAGDWTSDILEFSLNSSCFMILWCFPTKCWLKKDDSAFWRDDAVSGTGKQRCSLLQSFKGVMQKNVY